jgi:hypothetical protein
MRPLRDQHSTRTVLVGAVVVVMVALAVGVGMVRAGSEGGGPAVPAGISGLPTPITVSSAIRALAVRLHRVPELALIQLEPGTVRLKYYAAGRLDSGFFINWKAGNLGTPVPVSFANQVPLPRFDSAELRMTGVAEADRIRRDIGLGSWRIVRAEGYRRGAPITDGSGLVWRVTIENRGEQRYMFMNQAGRFLRIANVVSPA